jgi:hypothetical protein
MFFISFYDVLQTIFYCTYFYSCVIDAREEARAHFLQRRSRQLLDNTELKVRLLLIETE